MKILLKTKWGENDWELAIKTIIPQFHRYGANKTLLLCVNSNTNCINCINNFSLFINITGGFYPQRSTTRPDFLIIDINHTHFIYDFISYFVQMYQCENFPFVAHSGLKRSGKLDIVKISGLPVLDFFPDNKRNDTSCRANWYTLLF